MKDIFVCGANEDKKLSKKLVSKIEAEGYSCYVLPRDESAGKATSLIAGSRIFILLLSPGSSKSKEVAEQVKAAVDAGCAIIPFNIGKIEAGLAMQYMLHELEWVDAAEDGFDEAYDILLEIIEEYSEGKKTKISKKTVKGNAEDKIPVGKPLLLGIIAVLLAAFIYCCFFAENTGKTLSDNKTKEAINNTVVKEVVGKDLKEEENKIVGSWKMTEYQDSRILTAEEKTATEKNIELLKTRVLLTFNKDRSFTRAGFTPNIQKGYWEYDLVKKKIYLIPENINQKEEINIVNLSDKEMTFVVTEIVDIGQGEKETVTTKLTFQKQ